MGLRDLLLTTIVNSKGSEKYFLKSLSYQYGKKGYLSQDQIKVLNIIAKRNNILWKQSNKTQTNGLSLEKQD